MFPARVIGRVISTHQYETLVGEKMLLVQPITWQKEDKGDPFVAIDSVGSGAGETVLYVQSREAAMPFGKMPPVDAAIVAIIDAINITEKLS